jgi:serine/threonine-protein kinase
MGTGSYCLKEPVPRARQPNESGIDAQLVEPLTLQCYDPTALPSRSTSLHTDVAGAEPPDAFGPFRVLHQVGAGTLGPVFRAYDPEQDKLVAVKLFRLGLPPDQVHRFVAELERVIAADLTHPAIVAPIAAGIRDTSAYLAQDFVSADSLDIVVREHGPAPVPDALRVATQLAGALDFASVVDIGHGALHPRDVLLAGDDARLTGLGVLGALERVGYQAPVRRPYAAPERVSGASWDRRADVFSLAALIHELLWARRIPAAGGDAVRELTGLPGADLSELRDVFARALAAEPADRFSTALQFVEALTGAFARVPEPLTSSAPSPAPAGGLPFDAVEPTFADTLEAEPAGAVEDIDLRPTPSPEPAPVLASISVAPGPVIGLHAARAETGGEAQAGASAVWPFGLALVVGMALGFAGGYWTGSAERERSAVLLPVGDVAPEPQASARTGMELPVATGATEVEIASKPGDSAEAATQARSVAPRTPAPASSPGPRRSPATSARPAASSRVPPAATAGRLAVNSTPSGARVTVDGLAVGTTPLTVSDLGRGIHIVRVTRDGYLPQERRVGITTARPAASLAVRLMPEPRAPAAPPARRTASIFVESRPAGATVFLDGRRIGTTPLSIDIMPTGEHAVRLELAGYKPWTSTVRVVPGAKNRVAASLEQ